jgi:hypothetical protein
VDVNQVRLFYPEDPLRAELEAAGVPRDQQERRQLRSLLYSLGTQAPEAASADQMARLLLSLAQQGQKLAP